MVVYAERVFLNNLAVDAALLFAAGRTAKAKTSRLRAVLGAAAGAMFSVITPFLSLPRGWFFLIKILAGGVMVKLGICTRGTRRFLLSYGVTIGYTFLLGGTLYGASGLFGERLLAVANLPFYLFFATGIVIWKGLSFLFSYGKKLNAVSAFYYNVTLFSGTNKVHCRAFFDSGNRLTKGGVSVIVASERVAKKLLTAENAKTLSTMWLSTAGGGKEVPVFRLEKAEFVPERGARQGFGKNGQGTEKQGYVLQNPYIAAVKDGTVSALGCDLLFGAEALQDP